MKHLQFWKMKVKESHLTNTSFSSRKQNGGSVGAKMNLNFFLGMAISARHFYRPVSVTAVRWPTVCYFTRPSDIQKNMSCVSLLVGGIYRKPCVQIPVVLIYVPTSMFPERWGKTSWGNTQLRTYLQCHSCR